MSCHKTDGAVVTQSINLKEEGVFMSIQYSGLVETPQKLFYLRQISISSVPPFLLGTHTFPRANLSIIHKTTSTADKRVSRLRETSECFGMQGGRDSIIVYMFRLAFSRKS